MGSRGVTWDPASSAVIYFGTSIVPIVNFEPGKVETTREEVPKIGEGISTVRTVGFTKIGAAKVEVELADYVKFILPKMSVNGFSLIEFVIAFSVIHPQIEGSYAMLLDRCSIVGSEGPKAKGGDSNALIKMLDIKSLGCGERGGDGIWKHQAFDRSKASAQAIALMKF